MAAVPGAPTAALNRGYDGSRPSPSDQSPKGCPAMVSACAMLRLIYCRGTVSEHLFPALLAASIVLKWTDD